jgi:hypothetical protein
MIMIIFWFIQDLCLELIPDVTLYSDNEEKDGIGITFHMELCQYAIMNCLVVEPSRKALGWTSCFAFTTTALSFLGVPRQLVN